LPSTTWPGLPGFDDMPMIATDLGCKSLSMTAVMSCLIKTHVCRREFGASVGCELESHRASDEFRAGA
jgi:hypothetical protein